MMQIGSGTEVPVVHTAELLDWATGGPETARPCLRSSVRNREFPPLTDPKAWNAERHGPVKVIRHRICLHFQNDRAKLIRTVWQDPACRRESGADFGNLRAKTALSARSLSAKFTTLGVFLLICAPLHASSINKAGISRLIMINLCALINKP